MSTAKKTRKANKTDGSDNVTLSVQVEREIAEEFKKLADEGESDMSKELRKLIRNHLAKQPQPA